MAIVVLALFVLGAILVPYTRGMALRLATPVWQGRNFVSTNLRGFFSFFSSRTALVEENRLLRERLDSQEKLLVSFRADDSSRASLALELGRAEGGEGVVAGVLVRPPETPFDTLVIDAGTSEGIQSGELVTLVEGPAIGRVFQTFSHTSQVILYSTHNEKTDALLERNTVPVTLVGRGGGNFELILSRETGVEIGDRILTLGVEPRLLAVVQDVEISPTDAFKRVLALTPGSIASLRFVKVRP